MSAVTYDDEGNARRSWWMNSDDCGIGWYENGRFSLHVTWRKWAVGVEIPEPRTSEDYDRQFAGLHIGPFQFFWETTEGAS